MSSQCPQLPENPRDPESYRYFLRAAVLIGALAGAALGAINLTWIAAWGYTGAMPAWSWWPALIQAHGNAQLYGWTGLFIAGIACHSLPRMLGKEAPPDWLARSVFGLLLSGLLLVLVAQPLAEQPVFALLFVLGSALQCGGVVLFASYLLPALQCPKEPYQAFLQAGALWWALGSAFRVMLSFTVLGAGGVIPDSALNSAYLHVMTWGFLLSFVLAYSFRLLPAFTGTPAVQRGYAWTAFGLLTFSTALGSLAAAFGWRFAAAVAALLAASGVLIVLLGLKLQTPDLARDDREARWMLRFARTAYFWLAVATVVAVGLRIAEAIHPLSLIHEHAFGGAARHALTVGFVSLMMVGVAWRILPIFSGAEKAHPSLMPTVYGLLLAGCAMRVSGQIGAGVWGGAWYGLMGLSGWLETLAVNLFALDVLRLLKGTPESAALPEIGAAVDVSLAAPVGPLVAHRPWLVPVFAQFGMAQVSNALFQRTVGQRVTVEQACRRFQVPLEPFLDALKNADQGRAPV